MTLIKKQILIRTITMSIVLVLWGLAIHFIDNRMLFSILCIFMAFVSFFRTFIEHKLKIDSNEKTSVLSFYSYYMGDEREQHLMLNANYIAGQLIIMFLLALTVILAFANIIKTIMSISEIMMIVILVMIIHEWLVVGIYWYFDAKY